MSRIVQRFAAYVHSNDPLVAASNIVALVVAFNQPFYPPYVRWLVGDDHGASLVTFLSTPLFLAVPAVARLSSLAGHVLLPIVGILNTLMSTLAFGAASGVELFLCPCAMIAGMSLRQDERATMLLIGWLALAVFALTARRSLRARCFHQANTQACFPSTPGVWRCSLLSWHCVIRAQ
jgi:drug/metabolite transporter superfamily protein YnfA